MRNLSVLCVYLTAALTVVLTTGCVTTVAGITSYTGQSVTAAGTQLEYRFKHPGLTIVVQVENQENLIEPTSVGNNKSSEFRHLITYGTIESPEQLLITGRYRKELQLNNTCYPTVRNGVLTINSGHVTLDDRVLEPQTCG